MRARRVWLSLLGCLLMLLAAPSRAQTKFLTFRTEPPGARVILNMEYLGLSGRPLALPPIAEGADVELRFELEGYETRTDEASYRALYGPQTEYPKAGAAPIKLTPKGSHALVRAYGVPVALGALLLAGGLAYLGRSRRQLRRALQMEELIASNPSGASKIAQKLGGYLLVRELGGGGMARVYQGVPEKDLDASKTVAVKVMHREFAEDPEFKNRFYREIDLCRQLEHPNIVKLLSWGQSESQLFLVMELIDGGPMSRRLTGQPLGPEAALELLTPLFDAIAYAHKQGVIHRDLKPDNIMLTRQGTLKVTDFGLGRESQSDLTETGTTLGTPAYMAPEQIRGVGFEPASDQYALGIISYEVLSGRRPFQHSDPIQLIFLQVSQEPPALEGDLPPQVGEAVMRMLQKQPEQRFPSVEAAGRALLAALRDWANAPRTGSQS